MEMTVIAKEERKTANKYKFRIKVRKRLGERVNKRPFYKAVKTK